jgi:iron complex outermembrane receptor protein
MLKAHFLTSSAAIALLSFASPATAQDRAPSAPIAAEDADSGDIIVVTARRRSEEVQDVPISISVVDQKAIEATGSYNLSRLTQLQPTVQFFSSNPRNTAVNIRGLGAPFGLTNDGIEQGVGFYIDQVFYNRIAATTLDFNDVERVEVLRGPQGTLYGKNTTAGAINITTRKPSFSPEGRVEISLGNLGFKQAKASVSGPLAENIAARFAVTSTTRNGTIHNVAKDTLVNSQDNLGARAQFLWKASDTLEWTLTGDYNVQNPKCCVQIYVRTGATQRPLNRQYAALTAAQNYAVPSTDPFDRLTDMDADLQARNEHGGLSLVGELELGGGTLTSVSAWRYWDWQPKNDRDFTGLPITTKSENPTRQKQFSQEFRYAREGEQVDLVAGLFAFHQRIHTTGVQQQGPAASRWLIAPTNALSNDPSVLNGLTAKNDIHLNNTSLAAFGQLNWKVSDAFSIQPGIRVNYDKKAGVYNSVVTDGQGNLVLFSTPGARATQQRNVLAPQYFEPRYSDWNISYDLTGRYELSRDVMLFATYAKSFKSGGVNLNGVPSGTNGTPLLAAATVKPEDINHFEIGLKTQFLDRRATFNLSGFWTDIRNFQANVTNGQLGVLRGYLANAQKVRVRGVEADFSVRPSAHFSLYANAAYTDHEYVRFTDAPCPPELSGGTTVAAGQSPSAPGTAGGLSPANCDISGQWLPGISKWAFSYGAEYKLPAKLLGHEGEAYLGWDGNYRSRFSSNASRSAYTDIAGYSINNLRIGFRTEAGWEGFAWVRNAFDTKYFEQLAVVSGNTGLIVGQPGDPRTWGFTFKASF